MFFIFWSNLSPKCDAEAMTLYLRDQSMVDRGSLGFTEIGAIPFSAVLLVEAVGGGTTSLFLPFEVCGA